ncbi:hypothetical protein NPIL_541741 [Nephila pilipes]|uniref:Uncharacterized protein n=1 Tax=Nephila pilipes TaxID=299642 RepID=A0A8X6PGJ7_NEPPI|nr:hypothetical protein NPIL_541741 [Nephila pilipes]
MPRVEDIVSQVRPIGLDMTDGDVKEFVEGYSDEQNIPHRIFRNLKKRNTQIHSFHSKKRKRWSRKVPTSLIKEIFTKSMNVKNFVEKYHCNKGLL